MNHHRLRGVGFTFAAIAVLAGLCAGAVSGLAPSTPSEGGLEGPSQAWLLPAKAPGPLGAPALSEPLPACPDALRAQTTPRAHGDVASFDPPSEVRPAAPARRATLAQRGSVLNRITLAPHAPPVFA